MGDWLVGIVGIISLGLLLEIVLPEGQTTKYVKGAFSLLVIFVVVSPLPKVLGGEYEIDFDSTQYTIDQSYIDTTSARYMQIAEKMLEDSLAKEGVNAVVQIVAKDGKLKDIDLVSAKIFLSVIDEEQENTYILKTVQAITQCLGVNEDRVQVSVEYESD